MNQSLFMGLDISTSHIGICITSRDDKILHFENLDLSKLGEITIYEKAKYFRLKMIDIFEQYENIEKIYLEQALLMYKNASSRIQIIVLLQQFNALCQFVLNELGKTVILVPASTAMKAAIGFGRKPKYVDDKKIWSAEIFAQKHPETQLKKFEKGKNEGKIHSDMYDVIDAYFLSRSHLLGK